jgi:hypothetical protein
LAPARASAARAITLFTTATLVMSAGLLGAPALHATSVATGSSLLVAGYADGAPPGFSGGFGEQSCHACHFHADVNSGPGRVTIAGVPQRFVAGESYPLTITLVRPGMTIGGFQFTARLQDGGAQAGTLEPARGEEERIRIDVHGDVQYANQRQQATALVTPDTARWALRWTAPETSGPIVFHVAANAADGDESVDGDYIHTAVVEAAPSERQNTGGSVRAGSSDSPSKTIDRTALAEYRLTTGAFDRFQRASRRMAIVIARDAAFRTAPLFSQEVAQGGDVTVVATELETRLLNHPALSEALEAAAISAREYTKFALTLVAARLAYGFLEAALLKTVPSGVAADNVAFVRAHRFAADEILTALEVEIK